MKKNNFIIICSILFIIGLIIGLYFGIQKNNSKKNEEGKRIKEIYESKNEKESRSGKKFRSITLSENNVFYETTIDKVNKMIKNKENFFLYTGDEECPWCRATIEMADKVSRELGVKKIYYLQLWDDDHNELFRDLKEVSVNNEIIDTIKMSDDYKYLLDKVKNDKMKKYYIYDKDKNQIDTNEYRTYGANYFYFKKGKLVKFTDSMTESLTDNSIELSDKIKQEQEELYEDFFSTATTCDENC